MRESALSPQTLTLGVPGRKTNEHMGRGLQVMQFMTSGLETGRRNPSDEEGSRRMRQLKEQRDNLAYLLEIYVPEREFRALSPNGPCHP